MYEKKYYVYILTATKNTVLYTGVTNDLVRRVYQHKKKLKKSFTSRYNVDKLVFFETGEDIISAIEREKQIKGLKRDKKAALVNTFNPDWHDLYYEISGIDPLALNDSQQMQPDSHGRFTPS